MYVPYKPRTRRPASPDDFPAFQLFLLAIVRLAEPIALTSIFPYAWALVKHFRIGDESDASFYAGILISAFSLAEALMGMYWGGLSDRIGRKPVLLVGCFGTMISMVVVGLAPNFWVALLGRAFGGFLNGNIGVIQTMVGEQVKNPKHEPRAYAIMPFVWSIGTIIGPAIGGTFADPHASFPNVFPEHSLFARFPYLLPNLLCSVLLLVSIVLGYVLLEETHPEIKQRQQQQQQLLGQAEEQPEYVSDETPLLVTSDALKRPAIDLRAETYGTFGHGRNHGDHLDTDAEKRPPVSIFSRRIMATVLALAIFTYHSMAYDATLPIFFEDARAPSSSRASFSLWHTPGGLGLSLRAVGMIMAVNGAIALFVQAVVFPLAAARVGVYRLFLLVTVLHPLAYVLVPALLGVPVDDKADSAASAPRLLYTAIYACLTVRNLFAIIVYPLLLILIKEATPSPSVLGKVNGMAASAGAACRMVAPPIAGYLYAVGSRIDCTALAWYGAALVAVVGAVQCFFVERPRERHSEGGA